MELSIQEMVKKPIHEIPTRFIVDQEAAVPHSSEEISSSDVGIPVLDMKSLLREETKKSQLQKLHSACSEWGIFQLVNHGVDTSLMDKMKLEIKEFYNLPLEEKLKYKIKDGEVEGYGQKIIVGDDEKVDWSDRFYMITNPLHLRKPHLFPELPSSFRKTLEAYISELQKLSKAIFAVMAESLEMEETEAEEMFNDGMQSLRMTYYPPCPQPEKVMGLTPHSDASGITILLQVNGVQGLQVKKDGVWFPVQFLPGALVVNIGDILEIVSNGVYKSIEHRATVNSESERMAIAMFFSCKYEAEVGPAPSMLMKRPPVFRRHSFII
ncbi:codeine O-demethylase-like [Salvia hispanica]|uniref:codeine O-demethylase-like n=1 Tax=Salvia hispanica TaxID=49212 RepID=UPI0020092030|nr:codeine O-demethylase-like [Salvia hispanica]